MPNEGIAFYNEEMMLQAGLFEDAPLTRAIVYNFMRLRAIRVEVDVRLALGEIDIDGAARMLHDLVPVDLGTARRRPRSSRRPRARGCPTRSARSR